MTSPDYPVTRELFEIFTALFQQQEKPTPELPDLAFPGVPATSYGDAIPASLETRHWKDLLAGLPLPPGAGLLEFGCGISVAREIVEQLGLQWHGLDIPDSREAIGREDRDSVTYYDGSLIPFPPASYDAVLSVQVFEHVHDPPLTFGELGRILRPGGYLVGSTSLMEAFHSDSTFTYTPAEFTRLVESAGLQLEVVSAGIDGLTLLMRRIIRGFGAAAEVADWPYFRQDSPLNYLIDLCGMRQGIEPRRINALKLEVAGHFHFLARKA